MSAAVRITCLVNDTVGAAHLPVEHGLSFLIETNGRTILFDTGQTGLVVLCLNPHKFARIMRL